MFSKIFGFGSKPPPQERYETKHLPPPPPKDSIRATPSSSPLSLVRGEDPLFNREIVPVGKETALIVTTRKVIDRLVKAGSDEERTKHLNQLAEELLNSNTSLPAVSLQQFCFMHAADISENLYDGGMMNESLDAWIAYLRILLSEERLFFRLDISEIEINRAIHLLENAKTLDCLVYAPPAVPLETAKASNEKTSDDRVHTPETASLEKEKASSATPDSLVHTAGTASLETAKASSAKTPDSVVHTSEATSLEAANTSNAKTPHTPDAASLKKTKTSLVESSLAELKKMLKADNVAYWFFGYRQTDYNEGHIIPFFIQQTPTEIIFQPLNLGEGVEDHTLLSYTTSQEKIAYAYHRFHISNEIFWGEDKGKVASDTCIAAFCDLFSLLSDPTTSHAPYKGERVYDIFRVLGKLNADFRNPLEEFSGKGQHRGKCFEKAVKLVVRHILPKGFKKTFLAIYFISLRGRFHIHKSAPSIHSHQALEYALKQFGLMLEKMKGQLSVEEWAAGAAFVHKVFIELQKIPLLPQKSLSNALRKGSIEGCESFPMPKMMDNAPPENSLPIPQIPTHPLRQPHFESKTFLNDIKGWLKQPLL